jgi:hypothetical protein
MSDKNIQFEEDKAYVYRTERSKPIPEKGMEGWFYKKLPGKYSYKKNMLILIILGILFISFIFFILGIQNLGEIPDNTFDDRVSNTKAR